MRGVALADLHLGFSGGPREIGGRNARELDVEAAWVRAVENAVREQPDLVTVAGDIFHHPRVSHHAVKAFRNGIRRIVRETAAHVVVIQGNHDAPRSAATCTPIIIPDDYERVHVVLQPARVSVAIERTGELVSVACFPFVAMGDGTDFKVAPDPEADVNILLVHAAVKGDAEGDAMPQFYGGLGALDIGQEASHWDAICVGDFHDFRRLHPTRLAFYSGSIERTSSNIWPETAPKGVVAFDTATGELRLIEHETRPVFDYDLDDLLGEDDIAAAALDVELVNVALRRIADFATSAEAIVRLSVPGFNRTHREMIDWQLVRELKSRCLHFHLNLKLIEAADVVVRDRRDAGAARSLEASAREFFADDRPSVRDLALQHLGLWGETEEDEGEEDVGLQAELEEVVA